MTVVTILGFCFLFFVFLTAVMSGSWCVCVACENGVRGSAGNNCW